VTYFSIAGLEVELCQRQLRHDRQPRPLIDQSHHNTQSVQGHLENNSKQLAATNREVYLIVQLKQNYLILSKSTTEEN